MNVGIFSLSSCTYHYFLVVQQTKWSIWGEVPCAQNFSLSSELDIKKTIQKKYFLLSQRPILQRSSQTQPNLGIMFITAEITVISIQQRERWFIPSAVQSYWLDLKSLESNTTWLCLVV